MTFIGKSSNRARHIFILEDSSGRHTIPLEESKYSIGRQSSNDIVINSKQASRKHATLVRKSNSQSNGYSYWILDGDLEGNKSHNGIFVNGNKCLIHELKDGDLINFGCEVNASYHSLSNFLDTSIKPDSSQDTPEKKKPILNLHQKTTLILSDSHVSGAEEDTLQDKAYLDPLTGLPNRSLLNEYLSIAMGNAKRTQKTLAILFFDIEKLRVINDKFSYRIGDRILQEFGQIIKQCLRSLDIVARWGGDEFVALLPQVNSVEDIPKICQRIFGNFNKLFNIEEHKINLIVNLGFSSYPQDGNEGIMLLKKAESNLELNKQKSRQRSREQKATVDAQENKILRIENLLKQALQKQQLSVSYQPEINIKTGEIEGMEALLRWQHPKFGFIYPYQFIPWIEKTNLTTPITKWIMKIVCNQIKTWQKMGLPVVPVSINFSTKQLQQANLTQMLAEIIHNADVEPNSIIIEIIEQSLLENTEDTFRTLHELKQLGINVTLDDFGTGYASATHLQQFTFHKLKIAQSLLQVLKTNPEDTTMISAIIALGRTFNIKVVAGGVETQQQLDILYQFQCEIMQGYRFSQPLSLEEATELLSLHGNKSIQGKNK